MVVDRRQMIIDAATKSFSLFGYKATTMDQVAKLANVGKGTIYTFFKNKEELFDEIITGLINEMRAAADESFDPSLTFHEVVHRALFKMIEFRNKHQLMIKLFQEEREMGTPAVEEVIQKVESTIINYIKEKLENGVKRGEIQVCDPEITAFIIIKFYIALIFDWEKKHEPLSKEQIAKLFERYIFKGLSG
ncbi:TetR/AcrR family transcriptional regulator [Neobacillus sp. LXY-4]|uniref:TetR/AcrR family transcriptional regulator n=1 Tax=Neobacillus sp. LXY-4 TaxID=3379826 RepID=UPI003EE34B58